MVAGLLPGVSACGAEGGPDRMGKPKSHQIGWEGHVCDPKDPAVRIGLVLPAHCWV